MQDARQHAEQRHAEQRDHRQRELRPALVPEPSRARDVGQREGRGDDDRAQRRLRDVLHQAGREHQDEGDDGRADDTGDLRAGAGLLGDRGARAAGADREALEEAGGDVRRADADHLLVAVAPARRVRAANDDAVDMVSASATTAMATAPRNSGGSRPTTAPSGP